MSNLNGKGNGSVNTEIALWADNFIPVVYSDDLVTHEHTPQTPFCADITCPCQPISITFGNGTIHATSQDFVNGYQAGYLAYMVEKRTIPPTDEQIMTLVLEKLEDMGLSSLYGVGYAIGWLNTLARKG